MAKKPAQEHQDAEHEHEAEHEAEHDSVESAVKLVKMMKDGQTLKVHPSCVTAHINAGWRHAE